MVVFSDNVTSVIDVFEFVIIIDRLFDAPAARVIFKDGNVIVI